MNIAWPGGRAGGMTMTGRARDLMTPQTGPPEVLAEVAVDLDLEVDFSIRRISSEPAHQELAGLLGQASRGFKARLDTCLANEKAAGSPLYFLMYDISMLTRVGGTAWTQHRPQLPLDKETMSQLWDGRIACAGLIPGGYDHTSNQRGIAFPHFIRPAGELAALGDEWAWHEIAPAPTECFRRRRRIDAWIGDEGIEVDAHFRDSMWGPEHDELALHEYSVGARIDSATHELLSIQATPRVLPFPECPAASGYVCALRGLDVAAFRAEVHHTLKGSQCCTHLNDMLRGLSEVPILARVLTS